MAEYVPGPTLTEAVGSDGPLPQPSLEALAIGTATGLMAIHQSGLVHGELGPDHVVLGPDGPRVTHFGITPPYGAATPAADVRAWANTILFAAVGRRPTGPQDLAALADDLREVLAACLVPDAGSRPVARAVLIQLLGQRDLASGLLAEGSRRARAAAGLPIQPARPAASSDQVVPARGAVACGMRARDRGGGGCPSPPAPESHSRAPPRRPALRHATRLPRPLPSASAPAVLAGNWSGAVHQTSPVLTASVRISLPAGSARGTITYPGLGCSGRLAIVSVARDRLTLDQTISSGRKNCPDGVITLVSGPAGTVAFTFLRPGGGNPTGTLTRRA